MEARFFTDREQKKLCIWNETIDEKEARLAKVREQNRLHTERETIKKKKRDWPRFVKQKIKP